MRKTSILSVSFLTAVCTIWYTAVFIIIFSKMSILKLKIAKTQFKLYNKYYMNKQRL